MNAMDMFRPTPEANLQRPFNLGRVFYVDNGITGNSDSNEGTDPNHPLKKVQAGIDKCTDNQGDYVMVLDCYREDTAKITFDSATTHVIGLSTPASWKWTVLDNATTDLIQLSGNYMEIAGFAMCTTGKDLIHVTASGGGFCWLHDLALGVASGTTVNAIEFDGGDSFTNSLIENCSFGLTQTTLSGYGIIGVGIQYTVRNCTFKQIGTGCINITAPTGGGGNIYNNRFFALVGSSEAAGWAVNLGSGTDGWLVCHNWAAQAADASGNNPYKDTSTGNASTCENGWADNYDGSALTAGPDVS